MRAIFLSLILASTSVAAGLGGGNTEWDLDLCKERGKHWRNNQHNYIYSGLLGQVECPHLISVNFDSGMPRKPGDWSGARPEDSAGPDAWT